MKQDYHILGGGVGGLCTGLALQKEKLPFTLYEQETEIGYRNVGLGISRNIFPLLEHWSILRETAQLGAEIRTFRFVSPKLKNLRSLKMKAPALSVNRPKFHQLLYQSLQPETVKLETTRPHTDFSARQIVIAADGANSKLRKKFYPQLSFRKSGQLLWRGAVELKLPTTFQHTYHDFIGSNLRFAIIHSGGDLYSWYAVEDYDQVPPRSFDAKKHLLELFSRYHPLVKETIAATENIYPDLLQDIPPQDRKGIPWFHDNLVFLGDAIHPTTPNLANGACLAMEDAYVLARLFKKYNSHPASAFKVYQALREPKVNSIVRQSWMLGKLMHQDNPFVDLAIQIGTRLMPQWAFDKLYSRVLDDESLKAVED